MVLCGDDVEAVFGLPHHFKEFPLKNAFLASFVISFLTVGAFITLLSTGCSSKTPTTAADCNNIGYANAGTIGTKANNFIESYAVTVSSSVTVNSLAMSIGSTSTGNIVLGLYTNNGGQPQSLLTSGVISDTASSWNTVDVTPVVIGAGVYWLAFDNSLTATDLNRESNAVSNYESPTYTYNGTLPNPFTPGGLGGTNIPFSIYMVGCK
jgi:hypothetical protein